MNGNHILVYNNGSLIGASKSCDLQTDAETIEKSSPTSGQWREQVTKRKRWSVTVNYLLFYGSSLGVVGGGTLADILQGGNSFYLTIGTRGGGSSSLSGYATLTSCRITATRGNLATGSFVFTGNGALS